MVTSFLYGKHCCLTVIVLSFITTGYSQTNNSAREHLNFDAAWRFSFGHATDTKKDFNTATGYFSYLAKAAYGDGASAADFDDRSWRKIDLPHDWVVELPFDSTASLSHGFKAVGRNFPATSIGWYRKKFFIPQSDEGKRISLTFDGVFRNAAVWINGFYLGTEPSGYTGFEYNISEYLNYEGDNFIAIRADATMEEGWFYEGAGIYRHVWLNKTSPVHVVSDGTFITSAVKAEMATITAAVTIINETHRNKEVQVRQTIVNAKGEKIVSGSTAFFMLGGMGQKDISSPLLVISPKLWSLEDPYLYTMLTEVICENTVTDIYTTTFGIRTIRFDAEKGFFLNGKFIKIKGANNHQDHAGVGTAMPDGLYEYRIQKMKDAGFNAWRCAHNPPAPELLEACDRMGMLIIDENRLMGVSSMHLNYLKRFILRDRNHPSIISWSIGNEEWGIEGNQKGAKIAITMQEYVRSLDSTRGITAAISGGWQKGISNVIDIMGVNYIGQINTDEHHKDFPQQPMWGTEEGSTRATRGEYTDDEKLHVIAAYDKKPWPNFVSIEDGWKHYISRDYLAGMFIWTGFDYRGEPTPYGWPSVTSYFGMMDLCGFPKDNIWYLKSWWTKDTILHILPHWNWRGKEGKPVNVWVYSNCDEVELFLNKKSLGRKAMLPNGHLQWIVNYQPGIIEATGYKKGKKVAVEKVKTTGDASVLNLEMFKSSSNKEGIGTVVINVSAADKNGLLMPVADNEINFSLTGPAKIIGVGNGNTVSLERDRFTETISTVGIQIKKERVIEPQENFAAATANIYDDKQWNDAFKEERNEEFGKRVKRLLYRGEFHMPACDTGSTVTYFSKNIGVEQSVYINGFLLAENLKADKNITIDNKLLLQGKNSIIIIASPLLKKQQWDAVNTNPGLIQIFTPEARWKRKLFNGYAQVIIQTENRSGEIKLTAGADGLAPANITIQQKSEDLILYRK